MKQFLRKVVSIIILFSLLAVSFAAYGELPAWDCPECDRTGNTGNYCGGCGHPAPWNEVSTEPSQSDNATIGSPSSAAKLETEAAEEEQTEN